MFKLIKIFKCQKNAISQLIIPFINVNNIITIIQYFFGN